MAPSLPVWKRLLFATVIFVAFLALLEGALTALPWWMRRARGTVAAGPESAAVVVYCAGDSVTYGQDLKVDESYPWQLADRLRDRGLIDTRVMMAARPGAISRRLTQDVLPMIQRLPASQRPVVYALYGHNDYFIWDPDSTRGAFTGVQAPSDPRDDSSLRILRLLRWFRTASNQTAPNIDLTQEKLAEMARTLGDAARYLRGRGGDLVLMTYAVPPEPPASLPTHTAEIIHLTHVGQPVINAKLREIADDLDLDVLDLEVLIDTGEVWNTTWWMDNIHLTPMGLGRVAEEVEAHLLSSGLLDGPRQGSGT